MAEDTLRINYKSDFDFYLTLKDAQGNDVGFPDFDWRAVIYTSGSKSVEIGCKEGEPYGCFNDNGRIHVVMNNHGLLPGRLKIEVFADLPDAIYPDGYRLLCTPDKGDILLVSTKGDTDYMAVDTEVTIPAIIINGSDSDSGSVDLENYYTKAEVDEIVSPLASKEEVEDAIEDINISDYATTEYVDTKTGTPLSYNEISDIANSIFNN